MSRKIEQSPLLPILTHYPVNRPALYARADSFRAWLEHQHGRFLDIYTEHGGTKEETERFMAMLKRLGLPYIVGTESEVTSSQLHQPQPIFLHSELEHDSVIHENRAFLRLLQTSVLPGPRQ